MSGEGNSRPRSTAARRACQDTVSDDRLRGIRIFDISDITHAEDVAQRADLPRLAHPHGARRPEGQGQRLHLHLGLGAASARRTSSPGCVGGARRTRTRTRRCFRIEVIKVPLAHPEQAAIVELAADLQRPGRRRPRHGEAPEDIAAAEEGGRRGHAPRAGSSPTIHGAGDASCPPQFVQPDARQHREGPRRHRRADRAPTAPRCARRCPRIVAARFGSRRRRNGGPRAGPTQCHDITVYPAHRPGRRRLRRLRPAARHQRPGQPEAPRRGGRLELLLLALGDVQQRRHQDPVLRRVGRRRRSRSAAPTDKKEWGADAIFTIDEPEA